MNGRLTIAIVLLSLSAFAQEKKNVVQQAMRDELERNMKELKLEGFDRPFFINYSILDETSYQMTASLGALVNSIEVKNRAALSIRLLVGDYEFNDESLDNNLFSQPQANSLELPLDDDYLGIRRSLWISTDNVYRNAARQFAKNKELLKEQNKPLAEVPHRTFAKVSPSKINIMQPEVKFDKAAMEGYVRKVSAVFAEYRDADKQFHSTRVDLIYRTGYQYLENSEGSSNRIPVSAATLVISASLRTTEGEFLIDNIQHQYLTPELPPIEKTMAETKQLAEGLLAKAKVPSFEEEYVGPVLFEGSQVADLFLMLMAAGEDNLIATNNIPSLKGYSFESKTSMDTKIGKQIFADGLTIKAVPKMKKYGDESLLGGFEVDSEGVVPADETLIIENGVLKVLMNDRTLVNANQVANGLGDGPGVAVVTFKNVIPTAGIKAKLIEQVKKDGLEYGLLVKNGPDMIGSRMFDVYRVYADGREELARQATMKDISQRNFRKILAASKENAVHNIAAGRETISVICPQAVLLEEVEFESSRLPRRRNEEYVASPLKK